MNIVIIGGTFNPVHFGHLFLAETVRTGFGYSRVLFVPTYLPVHKDPAPLAEAAHRLEMLRIATRPYPEFVVDDCEIRRGDRSYSIDTVREIITRYGLLSKPGFLIGDDLLKGFHQWKEPDALVASTRLIVAHRHRPDVHPFAYAHDCVDNPVLSISSSQIRDRVRAGESIRFLLPDSVVEYIDENGLYN